MEAISMSESDSAPDRAKKRPLPPGRVLGEPKDCCLSSPLNRTNGRRWIEARDVDAIRADFPILQRKVGGDMVFSTTRPPRRRPNRSSSHRRLLPDDQRQRPPRSPPAQPGGLVAYEDAHDRVAEFIGASGGREEVVFTKNTTESMNLVAYAWGLDELGPGDSVVMTEMEHHASLVTWQQIAKKTGAEVRYIRVDDDGRSTWTTPARSSPTTPRWSRSSTSRTRSERSIPSRNSRTSPTTTIRTSSSTAHSRSRTAPSTWRPSTPTSWPSPGHKMAGPTGIGALYGKRDILDEMGPYLYGGEMIRSVTYEDSTWEDLPWKFEAGTPPIAQGVGFAAAVDYLDDIGMENVQAHEELLAEYAYDRLSEFDDIEIYGPPGDDRGGLVSFNLDSVHAHDLSSILNEQGVAIRAGDHCTQPLHDKLGAAASTRASFYIYNTREEVDALVDAIDTARELFA